MICDLTSKCFLYVHVIFMVYFGECSIREVIVACYHCFP
jgi:hypothetical protein